MDPITYSLVTGVFAKARFVAVLNGLAPGTIPARLTRRD